jgi:hypothetical protein
LVVAGSFFVMKDVGLVLARYGIHLADVEPDDTEFSTLWRGSPQDP